jgi:CheY-like chemotaxis protein
MRGLLEARVGFVVVGEAADVDFAISRVSTDEPDVVIVDAGLLGRRGEEVVAAMVARRPSIKIVVTFADRLVDSDALLAAGAFMLLDGQAAVRIADILANSSGPVSQESATVGLDQAVAVTCRCDRDGCGGSIRFVASTTRLLLEGDASGTCLRCGATYRLVHGMKLARPVAATGPAAHRLLNAAAAAIDAVRAVRGYHADTDNDATMLLDIAERQSVAVAQGLRELTLGLPLGALATADPADVDLRSRATTRLADDT